VIFLHTRVCEFCLTEIPKECDNEVHKGICPNCERKTRYIIKENKPSEKEMVAEENNKQEKARLLNKYGVFGEGKNGKEKIEYVRLANLIKNECYKFITLEDDSTGQQEIYYYENGYYRPGGENRIKERVDYFLGNETSIHRRNEVIECIKNSNHRKMRELEPDERYINIKNGVYDIVDGKLLQHSPDFFFLNQIPVEYKKDADCPVIKQFFKDVLYPDDYNLMQEIFGYIMYRKYFLHKAFLFLGGGRNGKGTTFAIIKKFVGYENHSARSLHELIEKQFSKGDLHGKLVNLGGEMSGKALVDTDTLKILTGGEPITGEKKYFSSFSFVNYAKLIFNSNHIPHQQYDKSLAYFRRWIIVSFPQTFDENNPRTNPDIENLLTTDEEMSGLFNWAIEGLKRIREKRKFSYTYDDNEDEAGERYEMLAKPELQFMKDNLTLEPDSIIPVIKVYEKYNVWANERRYPVLTMSSFSRSIKKVMMDKEKRIGCEIVTSRVGDKTCKCYKNVTMINDDTPKNDKLDIGIKKEYPSDKLKRLDKMINVNREAGYKIDMDFLRQNFSDTDINHFCESGYLKIRGDGEYEMAH